MTNTTKRVDVERLVELLEEHARLMAIKDSMVYLSHYSRWDANAGNYLLENGRGLAELVATNAALLQQLAERDAEIARLNGIEQRALAYMGVDDAENDCNSAYWAARMMESSRGYKARAEAAERARDEDKQDAARYRYLRGADSMPATYGEEFDAQVDAWMAAAFLAADGG